jgi:hypothetical protein
VRLARADSGSSANARRLIVEEVKNGATICPYPASAAIARPAADSLPGSYPSAADSSPTALAISDIRPVAFGTAGPSRSPDSPSVSTCPRQLEARATAHRASRYSSPDEAIAAPTAKMATVRTKVVVL